MMNCSAHGGSVRRVPAFINKVWRVDKSANVAPGRLYVFLSEGSLVITSLTGTPALRTWRYANGKLTMVEDGIPYKVDMLRLNSRVFPLRIHNPGGAVEMRLVLTEVGSKLSTPTYRN